MFYKVALETIYEKKEGWGRKKGEGIKGIRKNQVRGV